MGCASTHGYAMVYNMTWWKREVLATGDTVIRDDDESMMHGKIVRMRFNGCEVKWADGTQDVYPESKLSRVKD